MAGNRGDKTAAVAVLGAFRLSDDVRESETEGKCSVSGDLKIYPPNLLSMDRAVCLCAADPTQPYRTPVKLMMRLNKDNFKDGDNWNSDRWLKPNFRASRKENHKIVPDLGHNPVENLQVLLPTNRAELWKD